MEEEYVQGVLFPDFHSTMTETGAETFTSRKSIFQPGNRFSLDICQHIEFSSTWQMPIVKSIDVSAPPSIKAFYRTGSSIAQGVCGHCYTDDRRLLPFVTDPYRMVKRLRGFDMVIGIDLSIKPEMPLPLQISISFYNKMIMAFWQSQGLKVIENVVWAGADSYDFCFDGYATGSVVAVNSTGIGTDKRSGYLWDKGYIAMLDALRPSLILRYGAKRSVEREDISVYYENDNKLEARSYGR
ncbi:MAG: DUF4417 domain-containing protein [Bacteroidaceae bacterium]|nr:DUF4417 domain-containing protein [Bacteroidaceae bacterium]